MESKNLPQRVVPPDRPQCMFPIIQTYYKRWYINLEVIVIKIFLFLKTKNMALISFKFKLKKKNEILGIRFSWHVGKKSYFMSHVETSFRYNLNNREISIEQRTVKLVIINSGVHEISVITEIFLAVIGYRVIGIRRTVNTLERLANSIHFTKGK